MSRSKSTSTDTTDTTDETTTSETTTETTSTSTTTKTTTEKKMGVVRYLQDNPQNSYIECLMKTKYKIDFKTKAEWDAVVVEIKNKKTK